MFLWRKTGCQVSIMTLWNLFFLFRSLPPVQKSCNSALCHFQVPQCWVSDTLKKIKHQVHTISPFIQKLVTFTIPWEFCHTNNPCSEQGVYFISIACVFTNTDKCTYIHQDSRRHTWGQEGQGPLLVTGSQTPNCIRPSGAKSTWETL